MPATLWCRPEHSGLAASWLFSSRRQAHFLLEYSTGVFLAVFSDQVQRGSLNRRLIAISRSGHKERGLNARGKAYRKR